MKLPDKLTPEQSAAIVACLRILARRGEEILRERAAMQSRDATAPTDERATAQKIEVNEKENRRNVGEHSAAGGGTSAQGNAHRRVHCMGNERGCQVPIRRADGRVIGVVRGDTYFKKIHDKHFLDKPRGIASDVDALRQAQNAGAIYFVAHHVESGRDYRAPIARFFSRGIRVNRGYGEQTALVIGDFNCDDNTPTPTAPKPTQPALFNLSRWS